MNFETLLAYYNKNVPPGPEQPGTDAWNNRFNSWTSQLERELGIPGGDFNDPASGWAGIDPTKLDEFGTEGGGAPGTTTTVPLEQDLMGRTLGQYVYPGMARDAKNQVAIDAAVTEGNRSLDDVLALNQANINSGFSAEAYLRNNNPDPASWPAARASLQAIVDAGLATDLNKAAEYHYNTYGKAEGKKPGIVGALATELANADTVQAGLTTAAKTQQDANNAANLANTGVQQKAIADNQTTQQGAINAENTTRSLAQLTAEKEQADALTAQNAARLKDQAAATAALRTAQTAKEAESVAALGARTTALKTGSQGLTDASLAALARETADLGTAFETSATARERNLAALEGTRTDAAQGQVTGINLGLERTRDELAARAATQGYVGNSSMGDANLVRATVGARQNAAGVVGDVNVQNAGDRRTLGDSIAGQRFDLAGRDATGRRTLVTDGAGRTFSILTDDATDRYGLLTTGANERGNITQSDAAGNLATGNLTSTGRNTLAATGATARETLAGNTAAANTTLATTGANRLLALSGEAGGRTLANAATANDAIAGATRTTTGMRSDYFDGNNKRTLAAALIPQQVATDRLGLIRGSEGLGYGGARAGQDLLNWYTSNSAPPAAGTFTATPSQTGNGIAALGAGVTGGAFSVGNALIRAKTPAAAPPRQTDDFGN